MASYTAPKRRVSSGTTLTVSSASLPWVPSPGKYNTIYQSALPTTPHIPTTVDPELILEDGSSRGSLYRGGTNNGGVFSANAGEFFQMWGAQQGGIFNPLVGVKGSLMIWGGGHGSWSGTNVLRFDLATGLWSNYTYPLYCNSEKSIVGGTVAALTGHTVKPATSPVDSDSVNNRVSAVGNYIKYMDDTVIPGSGASNGGPGPLYGDDVTNWNPVPFHTNCGAAYLPPDAGGGSLGSLVFAGHDQSNVRVEAAKAQVFRFDCATRTWSGVLYGDLFTGALQSTVTPALEYDSTRKIMWCIFPGNTQPGYIDYKTTPPTRVKLGGNFMSYRTVMGNCTYVPSRGLMVLLHCAGDIPASNTIDPVNGSASDASRKRYPQILVWRVGLGSTPNNWSSTVVTTNPPSGATYLAHMEAGTDTGWPGFRSEISGRSGESELRSDEVTFGDTTPAGLNSWNNTCYRGANGVKLVDNSGITSGVYGKWRQDTRGSADRMEYSPIDDCLIYLDPVNSALPYMKLWKLKMPPVGSELTGTWTWEKEYIDAPDASTFPRTLSTKLLPYWGGRARYVDSLKVMVYTNNHTMTAGAVRSATWT